MFNRKYCFSGHLSQARFYSCVLDDEHLGHAVRYVERNPVRANMVQRAEDYPWSSAGPHVLRENDRYLDEGLPLRDSIPDWSAWLTGHEDPETIQRIRLATATGRVCGSQDFITQLESQTHRLLRAKPRGRKPHDDGADNTHDPLLPLGW